MSKTAVYVVDINSNVLGGRYSFEQALELAEIAAQTETPYKLSDFDIVQKGDDWKTYKSPYHEYIINIEKVWVE